MGGFAGGDEGGYWDEDSILDLVKKKNHNPKGVNKEKTYIQISDTTYSIKAHAKVNISQTHFKRLEELYDTISFVPCKCETFIIEGLDDIPLESNSIYKAYKALSEYTADSDIEEFFYEHKVVVTKGIPVASTYGGASSDAAAFLRLTKEVCNLIISTDELVKIGSSIGDDMIFFIYNYPSANISGYGEVVEVVEEK